jgi:hypothetical protein
MKSFAKFLALGATIVVAQASHAVFIVNVTTSTYAFTPSGSGSLPFTITGVNNEFISFNPGVIPVTVGDNTGHTTATVNIIYDVDGTNAYPVGALNLVFTGTVIDKGRIFWTELVENLGGQVVASASGSKLGSAYAGGSDGAFNYSTAIAINPALSRFIVKKTFFLDIGNATLPSNSLASLGTIQQGFIVPEPGTFVALGAGISLIALRLRRRK